MEEKQVKVKGGRKRKNLVKFYLNDEEYKKLCENAATFGRDKSKYLRLVIQWIAPIEANVLGKITDERFSKMMGKCETQQKTLVEETKKLERALEQAEQDKVDLRVFLETIR